MASTFTLSGDLADLGLHDFVIGDGNQRQIKGYVRTNLGADAALIDKTEDVVLLGTTPVTVAADGTFSVLLIDTSSTDLNVDPNTLQYEMVVAYVDSGTQQPASWASGWFSLTADSDLTDLSTATSPTAITVDGAVLAAQISDPGTTTRAALDGLYGHAPLGVSGRRYRVVAGVIRNAGAAPYWQPLNDSGHRPSLIDSVSTSTTAITINHAAIGATRVVSMVAVPDEALSAAGFTVGASAGLASTVLTLSRRHPQYSDFVSYNGTSWVSNNGVFTGLTFSGAGTLTANHPTLALAAAFGISAVPRGSLYRMASPGISFSYADLQFVNSAGAVVTTPNTNMGVYLSRGGHFEAAVNPQTVDTTAFPGSNIWVYGVLEV